MILLKTQDPALCLEARWSSSLSPSTTITDLVRYGLMEAGLFTHCLSPPTRGIGA